MRTTCIWQRYLSYDYQLIPGDGSQVILYLATNSLPDHCYYTKNPEKYPLGSDSAFNSIILATFWNLKPSEMDYYLDDEDYRVVIPEAALDIICDQ